jgi:L-ascorbate metabolism protein UlaG (beta-lactamase superfamily)
MGPDAFAQSDETALWWLTNAGFLINAHGTLVMVDPAISLAADGSGLSETGHRLLLPLPIEAGEVPRVDAVLYTHADYDHYASATARELMRTGALFLGPPPVADALRKLGAEHVHVARAGETVEVDRVRITVTPADHPWQARDPAKFGPPWQPEDCCGYLVATPDGAIWHPGDTRLMPEHLRFRDVDVLLLDVSRNAYHLGVESAARLANALDRALIIPHHYGSYDHPDPSPYNPYNGDPAEVAARVRDGGRRFQVLAPGEKFVARRKG